MNNKLKSIIAFAILSFSAFAQDKSSSPVTIKIKSNMPNTYCLLANHFGTQKYRVDSIMLDKSGAGMFVDKKGTVKGGIYMFVFPTKGNNYFELILSGKEKNIELTVDSANFNKVTFKNSEENTIFYNDIKYLDTFQREMNALMGEYNPIKTSKEPKDEAKRKDLETKIKAHEKKLIDRRLNIIKTKPNLFYGRILNLMREIDVPEAPKDASGKIIDSNFRYYYFKSHYWDYTDFNDDRLLYTPIFENKFTYYYKDLIIKHPDTIKQEIDFVLKKIQNPNSDMMRYCLATLLNDFANSKIMGHDALYVYIVDNYYSKGKAPWTDSASLKKMKEDADDLRPVLIGKIAPNFQVFDTSLVNYKSLYEVNNKPYKLLVFWSADCGHCKKEIPVIDSLYPTYLKNDIEVMAVSTVAEEGKGENVALWKNFIKDHKLRFKNYGDPKYQMSPLFKVLYHIKGTPEYFLLDKDNKIIAKKLAPEQIVDFVVNYKKSLK